MSINGPAATKNIVADAYANAGAWLSLHTGDPGQTGASEATGGGYARKQTTWSPAAGAVAAGSEVLFDVAAGAYTHWGRWTAQSGGTFRDGGPLSTAITLSQAGQIKAPITYTQS